MNRVASALQNGDIPGLEAEREDIRGHVGPRLVDHADDADRHGHPADLKAVRPPAHVTDRPDGILELSYGTQPVRHAVNPFRGQLQSVVESVGHAGFPGCPEVLPVRRQKLRRTAFKPVCCISQNGVFLIRSEA